MKLDLREVRDILLLASLYLLLLDQPCFHLSYMQSIIYSSQTNQIFNLHRFLNKDIDMKELKETILADNKCKDMHKNQNNSPH